MLIAAAVPGTRWLLADNAQSPVVDMGGYKRPAYHQVAIDEGQGVRLINTLLPGGLLADRVELSPGSLMRFDALPPPYEIGEGGRGPSLQWPPLHMSWPGIDDVPGGDAANACTRLAGLTPKPDHARPNPLRDCPSLGYSLRQAFFSDKRAEEVLAYGGTLGLRRGHELDDARRLSHTLYQWARFVTETQSDGSQRWVGWVCNRDRMQRLEKNHGLPPGARLVLRPEPGNAQCVPAAGPLARWLPQGWQKTREHDLILRCPLGGGNMPGLPPIPGGGPCTAHFMLGKEMFVLQFPRVPGTGSDQAMHNNDAHPPPEIWLRPRIVEAGWNALQRMQREARDSAAATRGQARRLQGDAQLCQQALSALSRHMQRQPVPDSSTHNHWAQRLHADTHPCTRAWQRAALAWHHSSDPAERQRLRTQATALAEQRSAVLRQAQSAR